MNPDDSGHQSAMAELRRGAGSAAERSDQDLAANVIRQKLENLYATEPDAQEEAARLANHKPPSKHQSFIQSLMSSGVSQEEIDEAWHHYYTSLTEEDKHTVWREFETARQAKGHTSPSPQAGKTSDEPAPSTVTVEGQQATRHQFYVEERFVSSLPPLIEAGKRTTKTVAEIKQNIVARVQNRQKIKAKHHLQSLLFGLGAGSFVMLILLFGFFNERFIAPFITPSRQVSATPIIIDASATNNVDSIAKIVIPKINVEIPVVYDELSIEDKPVQKALERGAVHYADTPSPGENGNVVILGHSSSNIFNQGKYKFAFTLLSRLEIGDTFYLTNKGKEYVYRVYDKKIVNPTEVSVLSNTEKPASATLITCDPPGTSVRRLVVVGEQISPEPVTNVASTAVKTNIKPTIVPSNAPSLWQRITDWL